MSKVLQALNKKRKEYYKEKISLSDLIDEWGDKHEYLGDFTVSLNYKNDKEVIVIFSEEPIQKVIKLLEKDFNLKTVHIHIHNNLVADTKRIKYILRDKERPYGV